MRDRLTPEQEAEVTASSEPVSALCVRYGVARKTIEAIRNRTPRKSVYASRERAPDYMAFVASLPCMMTTPLGDMLGTLSPRLMNNPRCSGRIEVDHAGERIAGMGSRSLDRDCIPMCTGHHACRTDYRGWFAGLDNETRHQWCLLAIALVQNAARAQGITVPTC